jgi:hypothetical protein
MYEPWGYPVHDTRTKPPRQAGCAVDRMRAIVRNPGQALDQGAHVGFLCINGRSCSGEQLLLLKELGSLTHKSPVLTSTSTSVFSLKE